MGVVGSVGLAFIATTVGARIWRAARRRKLVVEVSHYDQIPRVRMSLPIESRLEAFADAMAVQEFSDWWKDHRDELADNYFEAKFQRYRELFGSRTFLPVGTRIGRRPTRGPPKPFHIPAFRNSRRRITENESKLVVRASSGESSADVALLVAHRATLPRPESKNPPLCRGFSMGPPGFEQPC